MRIDLLHNKIVKDTLSPEFEQSVREVLVPIVREAYPEADGILMYEDYLADGFAEGGKWFYPLTVKSEAHQARFGCAGPMPRIAQTTLCARLIPTLAMSRSHLRRRRWCPRASWPRSMAGR